MTITEAKKLESWLFVLKDVQKAYPGNINLDTIITSINARIIEYIKQKENK